MPFPPNTLKEDFGENKKETIWTQARSQKVFNLENGDPFSFKNYEFFKQIYEDKSPMKVIQSSRQVGKTTFVLGQMIFRALEHGNRQILLAVPSKVHRDTIVGTMDKRIHSSPVIRSLIGGKEHKKDKKKKDNMEIKQFQNGSQISMVILKASPDVVRSKTSEFIFFDETQLISEENIQVTLEVTNTFPNPETVFTGTPVSPGNSLNNLYLKGNQSEWIVPCTHCGKNRFPLGPPNLDSKVAAIICRDCEKPLDATKGSWEAQNPSALYPSWRISALMRPDIQFRTPGGLGILDKMESMSSNVFYNEVMGLPAKLGDAVITEEDLQSYCDPGLEFMSMPEKDEDWKERIIIISVDWAFNIENETGATTLAALWRYDQTGLMQCLYAKRFLGLKYSNPELILEEILLMAKSWSVKYIFTDYRMGHLENRRLEDRLVADRITLLNEIDYTGTSNYLKHFKNSIYHINRTESLSMTLRAVENKKFMFPKWSQSEPYLKDLLNVYQDRSGAGNLVYNNKGQDDFFHCMNYAYHGFIKMRQSFVF